MTVFEAISIMIEFSVLIFVKLYYYLLLHKKSKPPEPASNGGLLHTVLSAFEANDIIAKAVGVRAPAVFFYTHFLQSL